MRSRFRNQLRTQCETRPRSPGLVAAAGMTRPQVGRPLRTPNAAGRLYLFQDRYADVQAAHRFSSPFRLLHADSLTRERVDCFFFIERDR
jgi:hypothetical protein